MAMREALLEARLEAHELLRKREQRTPWQPLTIMVCIVLPVALFASVSYICFSHLRHSKWWAALLLGPLLGLLFCTAATLRARKLLRSAERGARAAVTLATCLWAALLLGLVGGDKNYWWHAVSYYSQEDLATYVDIDPSADKGQSYMDAGQVYFKEGTTVSTSDLVGFRSDGLYCVAPITRLPIWAAGGAEQMETGGSLQLPESGTIDFWAVGRDCCDPDAKTFSCGNAGDPRARAGLRLLRDDARPFYLLAVQEWVARVCPLNDNTAEGRAKAAPLVCLPARHPLFFYYVLDPIAEVDAYHTKALNLYSMQVLQFFAGDLMLALALLWLLFSLGLQ